MVSHLYGLGYVSLGKIQIENICYMLGTPISFVLIMHTEVCHITT